MRSGRLASLDVVTSANLSYLPWVTAALVSCAEACRTAHLVVHLVHADDLTPQLLSVLDEQLAAAGARLRTIPLEAISGVAELSGLTIEQRLTCVRLCVPDFVDTGRAVYLDADTFTVGDIGELAEFDLAGRPIGAVSNIVLPHHETRLRELDLPTDAYFNAGVLLMDLDALRRERASQQLLKRLRHPNGDLLEWLDQDVLNLVFDQRWAKLPARWNTQNSFLFWRPQAERQIGRQVGQALADPAIWHFEGPAWAKPWHSLSPHPFTDRYRAFVARGPWGPQPTSDKTPVTAVLRRLGPARSVRAHDWLLARGWHSCRRSEFMQALR